MVIVVREECDAAPDAELADAQGSMQASMPSMHSMLCNAAQCQLLEDAAALDSILQYLHL